MSELKQAAARLLKQAQAAYSRSIQRLAAADAMREALLASEVQVVAPKPVAPSISRAWMEREIARRQGQGLPPEFGRTGPTPPDNSPESPKR